MAKLQKNIQGAVFGTEDAIKLVFVITDQL